MKKFLLSFAFLPLFFLAFATHSYADTRLEPVSYEPIVCGSDCTTLRVYYNQAPPIGQGWGLANYNPCCDGWSGSAGPSNIHDDYADYTWYYPYNQGTDFVVLQNGDTVSSPFTIDFSISEQTTFSTFNSVEETGYEFIPCSPDCGTVRIHYAKIPPTGGWGLVNWQNHTLWSGAAGPANVHDTYADYTFNSPYVPTNLAQYSLVSSDDFSSPFTVDWSTNTANNTTPYVQSLQNETIDQGATYSASGSFTDPDSTSWTATIDYGDGSGVQPLTLSGMSFSLSHQYNMAGTYTVALSITDNQGATGTITAIITVNSLQLVTTTFDSVGDTYIRSGEQNRNLGAGLFMKLSSSGSNRSLVKFDQSALQFTIGNHQVLSAKLRLTITDNGNNWGSIGRTVGLHRLLSSWSEGNGIESNRGAGSGATWNCAIDSNIANQNDDCSGSAAWNMNNNSLWPFASAASGTTTITNNQNGVVEFDVTSDVQSFMSGSNQNYGWLLKKTNESQAGQVSFGTRETINIPQLVVTYQP